MSGHPELKPFFREAADVNGAEIPIWLNLNPYSDHWSFHLQGVTTCLMGDPVEAKRRGGRAYGHTVFDTVDKVDLRSQMECIANASIAAVRIANAVDWPGRHRSQEEIEGFVERWALGRLCPSEGA